MMRTFRLGTALLAVLLAVGTAGCAHTVSGWIVQTRNHQGDVALAHHRFGMTAVPGRVRGEADLALVIDERVAGEDVAPTLVRGTPAEVDFLTVTASEACLVEPADRVEGVAPYVHAEADAGRKVDRAAPLARALSS